MIPRLEWSTLLSMVYSARALAGEGRFVDGYTCLTRGLHHAETLARRGEPWAGRLVRRYRKAIDEYTARFGVYYEACPAGGDHPDLWSSETHPAASPSSEEGRWSRAPLADTQGKAAEERTEG
jgi:hypothetical protein